MARGAAAAVTADFTCGHFNFFRCFHLVRLPFHPDINGQPVDRPQARMIAKARRQSIFEGLSIECFPNSPSR
jgi:hypothetical protein